MILALAVGFGYFGFGISFFLGFFFFLRCVVVDNGERWLWPVVVVVGLADAELFVVFLWEMIYYFIVRNILFYCDMYIILLYWKLK